MVFAYYHDLTRSQQIIYRRSNALDTVPLTEPEAARHHVQALLLALKQVDSAAVTAACQGLCDAILSPLDTPRVIVRIEDARPTDDYEELYGLYEPLQARQLARITLWMRTARRQQVVAFRTFMRTLLHELCHHLDYEYFRLPESFHTEGFYRRESSLFRQLLGETNAQSRQVARKSTKL